jgi:hypothetical protein
MRLLSKRSAFSERKMIIVNDALVIIHRDRVTANRISFGGGGGSAVISAPN